MISCLLRPATASIPTTQTAKSIDVIDHTLKEVCRGGSRAESGAQHAAWSMVRESCYPAHPLHLVTARESSSAIKR